MDETGYSEFRDAVRQLAADLLSNEILVAEQADGNREQTLLFYGHAEVGGDTVAVLNDHSREVSVLCSTLLSASALSRRAAWNLILTALH